MMSQSKRKASKRKAPTPVAIASVASVAACVLIVIVVSAVGQRSYYLGSALMIACIMVPFVMAFEAGRPRAREVVLLAVLCALAVVSRVAFFWLPHFKPMAAIVMIAGIALGPQSGFLAGALSMLVSNLLFGQGYWTPWQMLAFGLAGFVFGGLAKLGVIRRSDFTVKGRIALAVMGAAFVLLVIGPLLDTSSLFLFLSRMTVEGVVAIYLAGVPINAMHALATAITLLLLANPMLSRIARLRTKFGLTLR